MNLLNEALGLGKIDKCRSDKIAVSRLLICSASESSSGKLEELLGLVEMVYMA